MLTIPEKEFIQIRQQYAKQTDFEQVLQKKGHTNG